MFVLPPAPAGSILYLPFDTYDGNGGSVTITGLAVTDIEIYKNGSTTQRSSDNGYALLDTDGIDFDGTTGLHGISIDLGDNSDSGFYAAGGQYWLNVNAITVDSQTVRFTYYFRIVAAESSAGVPKVDVSHYGGSAGSFSSGRPEVNATHIGGGSVSTSSAMIGVNVVNAAGTAWNSGAIQNTTLASNAIGSSQIASGALTAAAFAANSITAAKLDPDVTTELQSGLATLAAQMTAQTSLNTIANDVINLDSCSVASIAAGVRTELTVELARIDAAVTTRATPTNITAATGITIGTNGLPAAAVHAAAAAKIADVTLRRTAANVEASSDGDALAVGSLYGMTRQVQTSEVNGTDLDIYKSNGTDLLDSLPLASATSDTVITGIGL